MHLPYGVERLVHPKLCDNINSFIKNAYPLLIDERTDEMEVTIAKLNLPCDASKLESALL